MFLKKKKCYHTPLFYTQITLEMLIFMAFYNQILVKTEQCSCEKEGVKNVHFKMYKS